MVVEEGVLDHRDVRGIQRAGEIEPADLRTPGPGSKA
jgi:hypothetical protein